MIVRLNRSTWRVLITLALLGILLALSARRGPQAVAQETDPTPKGPFEITLNGKSLIGDIAIEVTASGQIQYKDGGCEWGDLEDGGVVVSDGETTYIGTFAGEGAAGAGCLPGLRRGLGLHFHGLMNDDRLTDFEVTVAALLDADGSVHHVLGAIVSHPEVGKPSDVAETLTGDVQIFSSRFRGRGTADGFMKRPAAQSFELNASGQAAPQSTAGDAVEIALAVTGLAAPAEGVGTADSYRPLEPEEATVTIGTDEYLLETRKFQVFADGAGGRLIVAGPLYDSADQRVGTFIGTFTFGGYERVIGGGTSEVRGRPFVVVGASLYRPRMTGTLTIGGGN